MHCGCGQPGFAEGTGCGLQAVNDGLTRMEVEFPALPNNVDGAQRLDASSEPSNLFLHSGWKEA